MKRFLVSMLVTMLFVTQTSFAEQYEYEPLGPDGVHYIFDTRPDGELGFQWYEEAWTELDVVNFATDKKGNCTSITLFDEYRGLKLSFEVEISKKLLAQYKLKGNKFFYNYQADWLQVETKGGDIIYTDVPMDDSNGEIYNIIVN